MNGCQKGRMDMLDGGDEDVECKTEKERLERILEPFL